MQAEPLPRVTRSVSEPSAIEADVRRARRAVLEAPRLEQQEKQQEKQQQQQQLPDAPRPRDRWKRTRRTFYVAVIVSILGMSSSVGRLHSHEARIAEQQAQMDQQKLESRRWRERMLAIETGLLIVNAYGLYRGVKFAMLLKRIRLRSWIDNIRARMPFVRATARVIRGTGSVFKTCAWPVRFPVAQAANAFRRHRALRKASLARKQVNDLRRLAVAAHAAAKVARIGGP